MKEKMRILVVEPAKRPYVKEIEHTLEEMQKVVGGSIQALYPFEDRVGLICNDEAKIAGGFTPNRALRDENGNVYDIIFGTFSSQDLEKRTFVVWMMILLKNSINIMNTHNCLVFVAARKNKRGSMKHTRLFIPFICGC